MSAKSTPDHKSPYPPMRKMTEDDLLLAAALDPDAQPWTDVQLERALRWPRVKTLRRILRLTQEQFAASYQIPLGIVRDWEQGQAEPDATARAYLRAIAGNPAAVLAALQSKPEPLEHDA